MISACVFGCVARSLECHTTLSGGIIHPLMFKERVWYLAKFSGWISSSLDSWHKSMSTWTIELDWTINGVSLYLCTFVSSTILKAITIFAPTSAHVNILFALQFCLLDDKCSSFWLAVSRSSAGKKIALNVFSRYIFPVCPYYWDLLRTILDRFWEF